MTSNGETLLEAKDVVGGYIPEVNVLTGCSIHLNRGEIVGIIGPNGAGKSTMLKAIFGLLKVRGGSIEFEGQNILGLPSHKLVKRGLGYVPQISNTFLQLTVEENLKMGAWVKKGLQPDLMEEVFELFPKLQERWGQLVWQMSGGERQMVAMTRSLVADPKVLLLDEPSAALSPANQTAVFQNILKVRDHGVSILIVEQNARECLSICDRAYMFDQGEDVYEGYGPEMLDDEKVKELFLASLAAH